MRERLGNKKFAVVLLMIIVGVISISYAFFSYYKLGENEYQLIMGNVYLNLDDGVDTLTIPNVFPETAVEARQRNDNVLTFTIKGRNTTENKDIYYEIMLSEGDEDLTKNKFDVSDLVFDLVEVTSEGEVFVVEAQSYSELDGTRIWVDTILKNTTDYKTRTYKLRMWLNEDVIISDTDPSADYTTGEYKNSYASVKISAYGDFEVKTVPEPLYSKIETTLAANLTEADVDGTRYVTGQTVNNNYVWYSGKLWRIVALNADGTVKLVTQNAMTALAWSTSTTNTNYSTSQIRTWLNSEDYFLGTINEDLIVESEWDYTTYENYPTEKITDSTLVKTAKDKVGLLSIYDFMMTGGSDYYANSKTLTFLNNGYMWWTISPKSRSYVWVVYHDGYANSLSPINSDGARPSVNLKSGIEISGGTGIESDPYRLEGDYEVGQENELLNERISGEYINFNGVKYRIVGIENGLTKITMADYDVNKNTLATRVQFGATSDSAGATFTTSSGIGKYLNDWYNATTEKDTEGTYTGLYLSEDYWDMIATPSDGVRWYQGPDEGIDLDYTKATQGTAIDAIIGLGRYGEMFSSQFGEGVGSSTATWLITKYDGSYVWVVNNVGNAFKNSGPTDGYGARPSMYLKSDVKIVSGTGLPGTPYEITQ